MKIYQKTRHEDEMKTSNLHRSNLTILFEGKPDWNIRTVVLDALAKDVPKILVVPAYGYAAKSGIAWEVI